MKQMKKYLFRLVAFLGLTITPFIASAEEVSLGESISKFLNDTGFARLVEGNWLCLVMIAVACLLFYLAIVKKFEPLLLLPIAFGMLWCCRRGTAASGSHPHRYSSPAWRAEL